MMLWLITVSTIDTECYAEGASVAASINTAREGCVEWVARWANETCGGDDDEFVGEVRRALTEASYYEVDFGDCLFQFSIDQIAVDQPYE